MGPGLSIDELTVQLVYVFLASRLRLEVSELNEELTSKRHIAGVGLS